MKKRVAKRVSRKLKHRLTWMLVGTGSAMAVGALVDRALESGWRLATDDDPPTDRDILTDRWKHALLWSIATGVIVSAAQLLAKRGAAAGWRHVTGRRPPI